VRILRDSQIIIAVFPFRLIDKSNGEPVPSAPGAWRQDAEQNGLDVQLDTCVPGRLHEAQTGVSNYVLALPDGRRLETYAVRGFFFCRATFRPELRKVIRPDSAHEVLFDKIEASCPSMYFPRGTGTSCSTSSCKRVYNGTDSYITIDNDGNVRSGRFGAVGTVGWGNAKELLSDSSPVDCHAQVGRYAPWSPGQNNFPGMTNK
jgi:hypothetical protein